MSVIKTDTIAAIATPPGRSALAIIRISGPKSFAVADSVLKHRRNTSACKSHSLHHAMLVDKDDIIDDVMVAVFHAPKSFTGENTVEITCHGGSRVVQKILELLLSNGARHAEPGEFTLRAYLNGKLDLAQAEAVIDTIDAKTDTALKLAKSLQRGDLSRAVDSIRLNIMGLLVRVEATIDFPEDVGEFPIEWGKIEIGKIRRNLRELIETATRGIKYREGISVVLAGAPNAGKSSLLNALLRTERAIVTAIPGTTRDVIEESIEIAGIPVRLTDTAGLRQTSDEVERIGVERTHGVLELADIVIEVRDASQNGHEPISLSTLVPTIVVLNKSDLAPNALTQINGSIRLSAKTGNGLDILEARIAEIALGDTASSDMGSVVVSHTRHKSALISADNAMNAAQQLLDSSEPLDLMSIELTSALTSVGQITGETTPEEIVNDIFHRFCIGK